MSFKRSYSSEVDDIVNDFYVPALEASVEYQRLAGFFSSSSLAVAARGLRGLLTNGGRMNLICSPKLTAADVSEMQAIGGDPAAYLAQRMVTELEHLEDGFVKDHVRALGWMVATGALTIRICLLQDERGQFQDASSVDRRAMFHQKVGILRDSEGSCVTFSGSANESATAWLGNIEEFKVFRGWEPLEAEYQFADIERFDRLWKGRGHGLTTLPLPEAVRQHLVEIAPEDTSSLDLSGSHPRRPTAPGARPYLFNHQRDAVAAWVGHGCRGLFHMATGTGKTLAALGCLEHMLTASPSLVAVITCPYSHLVQQWHGQIGRFGIHCDALYVADGTRRGWKRELSRALVDAASGVLQSIVVLTTHSTFSSEAFMKIVRARLDRLPSMVIADEVHGLGAPTVRRGLLPGYESRLGLSATPVRLFDDEGTELIDQYFGGTVYEFPLDAAIGTINPATGRTYLVPYGYMPHFVFLTHDEMEEYIEQTKRITRKAATVQGDEQQKSILERLLFKRADIIKSASGKIGLLSQILDDLGRGLRHALVYCSPGQIDPAMATVSAHGLVAHRFTMDEGTAPKAKFGNVSEREYILRKFGDGDYQILVAMKCLDEGVDVPEARTAVLMASGQEPREYVQRIGRVLRPSSGKWRAEIHDMVVLPLPGQVPPEFRGLETRILDKEIARCEYIARSASNSVDALAMVYESRKSVLEGMK